MADTTIDLLKNSSYVGKMDELIAAVKLGGSTGGTNDHSKLINRDAADQHPIGAITGLEAALTNIPPTDAFIVTLTQNEVGTYSVDKTFAEIVEAIQSNRATYLYYQNMYYPLLYYSLESYVAFGFAATGSASVSSALFAVFNDDHVETQKTVLRKLPNPNALTFTGAATGSYDGSAPLSVEIPSGGGAGGGSSQWKIIRDLTITENTDRVDINIDDAGEVFSLHEIQVFAYTRSHGDTAESFTFLMNGYWGTGDPYFSSGFKSTKSSDNYYAYNHFIATMQNGIANVFQPWKQYITNQQTGGDVFSIGDKYQAIESVSFVGKFIAGCRFVLFGRVSS